jgi:hypothetical protein
VNSVDSAFKIYLESHYRNPNPIFCCLDYYKSLRVQSPFSTLPLPHLVYFPHSSQNDPSKMWNILCHAQKPPVASHLKRKSKMKYILWSYTWSWLLLWLCLLLLSYHFAVASTSSLCYLLNMPNTIPSLILSPYFFYCLKFSPDITKLPIPPSV